MAWHRALEAHGIRTIVVETAEEARKRVLELIPDGADVYNSPSRTLETIVRDSDTLKQEKPIASSINGW